MDEKQIRALFYALSEANQAEAMWGINGLGFPSMQRALNPHVYRRQRTAPGHPPSKASPSVRAKRQRVRRARRKQRR